MTDQLPTVGFDAAQLRALRRVAEAATQGSWDAVVLGSEGYEVRAPNLDSPIRRLRVARCGYEKWEIDRANAEHIGTFDPPMVLALLDEVDRLRTNVTPPAEPDHVTGPMPWPIECDHTRATCEEVGCPNADTTVTPPSEGRES